MNAPPATLVVGVDPGMTTGVVSCEWTPGQREPRAVTAVQVHGPEGVVDLVRAIINRSATTSTILAVEEFVVSTRAARSRHPLAGRVTRRLVAHLEDLRDPFGPHHVSVVTRPAAAVKPWATDDRLRAAGLHQACGPMSHARDAARHNLFAAVRTGLTRDPLAKAGAR